MNDNTNMKSIGVFEAADAHRLLDKLVSVGMKTEIEINDGIYEVEQRYGSGGMKTGVEVFVPPGDYDNAITICGDLGLKGQT